MSLLQEAKKIVHSVPQNEGTLAILAGGGGSFQGILGGLVRKLGLLNVLIIHFQKSVQFLDQWI